MQKLKGYGWLDNWGTGSSGVSLTHMAVFLNTYTCLLYALFELAHSMVARFQEQVFKEKQAEIYYLLWPTLFLLWPTQPYQEGRNTDSTIQYTACHILHIK